MAAVTCVPSLFPFGDLARAFGYEVREIESDHEVMLSRPATLLEALASFSAATVARSGDLP